MHTISIAQLIVNRLDEESYSLLVKNTTALKSTPSEHLLKVLSA